MFTFCLVSGFNLGKGKKGVQNREINQETCHMPGFTVLQWLLPKHASVPGIYFLLMAMSLGQHVRELPENCQVSPFPPKPHSLLSSFSVFLPLVLFSVRFLTFSLSIHVFPLHCLMLTLTCSYLFMFVVLSFSLRERLH